MKKMDKIKLGKVFACNILVLFLLACVLPPAFVAPTQPIELISQEDLGTLVAQTSNAAQIQTASALPTITPTFTSTRIPSVTPTSTPTFIFLLSTATLVPSYTPILPVGQISVNGTITVDERLTDRPWTCLVTGSSPDRSTVHKQRSNFDITWTVMNTGTKAWSNNGIDFVHTGGYESNQRPTLDLPKSIASGNSIYLTISMTTPKSAGTYNTYWSLKVGQKSFCYMKFTFKVD